MPPGQPIRRCESCRRYRPCRVYDGAELCVECSPEPITVDGAGNTLHANLAADGGNDD